MTDSKPWRSDPIMAHDLHTRRRCNRNYSVHTCPERKWIKVYSVILLTQDIRVCRYWCWHVRLKSFSGGVRNCTVCYYWLFKLTKKRPVSRKTSVFFVKLANLVWLQCHSLPFYLSICLWTVSQGIVSVFSFDQFDWKMDRQLASQNYLIFSIGQKA